MTKLFFFCALFYASIVPAQKALTFEKVNTVKPALSKEDLFKRGEEWVVSTFKNPQSVLQLTSEEDGKIVCNGSFNYKQKKMIWGASDNTEGFINFTISLYFKDGRYKYVITDFIHEPYLSDGYYFGLITTDENYPGKMSFTSKKWREWIWNDIKEQIEINVSNIEKQIVYEMNKKTEIENTEW